MRFMISSSSAAPVPTVNFSAGNASQDGRSGEMNWIPMSEIDLSTGNIMVGRVLTHVAQLEVRPNFPLSINSLSFSGVTPAFLSLAASA